MAEDKNKIVDRLFENRLKDAVAAPPGGLWDSIAADLENDRLRKKVAMWRWVAAASIVLFIGFGAWTAVHLSSPGHRGEAIASRPVISLPFADPGQPQHSAQNSLATAEECPEAGSALIADAGHHAPNAVLAIKVAAEKVRHEKLKDVRHAASLPAVLTAIKARKITGLAPGQPTSFLMQDDWSAYSQAGLSSDLESIEPKEDPRQNVRIKRRDREILAWNEGDAPDRDKNSKRWSIGGAFSPDVAFGTQIPVGNSGARTTEPSLPDDPAASPRRLSDPVAAYSTGIRAALDLNDRMAVRSGVLYSRRTGSQTELSNRFGMKESFSNSFSVDYLEIPLSFQYKLVRGKALDYYVSSGVSGNLMLGYQQALQNSEGRITSKNVSDQTHAFAPAQANLLLSTGMQYHALDRLSINLEPGIRYGVLTSDYAFSREGSVSFSLASSLNFHF